MRKYYYDKYKVIQSYGGLLAIALIGFLIFCYRFDAFRKVYLYTPIVLYGIYVAIAIIRKMNFKEAVVSIMPDRLIVEKINAVFVRSTIEISFAEIQYISTDMKRGFKTFYVKTKDDSEYKFNFTMLDATHEEIVAELKKIHQEIVDAGVFEYDDDNSLNMD